MVRLIGLACVAVALALVPAAGAAFPAPYAQQGDPGVLSRSGAVRFVAYDAGESTRLVALRQRTGKVMRSQLLQGSFGIPVIANRTNGEGLFHDGSSFVLQSVGVKAATSFDVVNTRDLAVKSSFTLPGTFSYDALSPDGQTLYLTEHTSVQDVEHYVVRAYDIDKQQLRPNQIADKTQKNWVMQGWPAARTTSADGRWVYTLYANPGGVPFVHALDTVKAVAHCIGIRPPSSDQSQLFGYKLALKGQKLLVRTASGVVYRAINRTTWKVTAR